MKPNYSLDRSRKYLLVWRQLNQIENNLNSRTVKVSKVFKQMATRRLEFAVPGSTVEKSILTS